MENDKKTSPLSNYSTYIHLSRYAKWDDVKKRRETWEETIRRYTSFFSKKFQLFPEDLIFNAIKNIDVMPSMRGIMTAGAALERDNIARI
jgi:ribonucleoside-triphosphate reductase